MSIPEADDPQVINQSIPNLGGILTKGDIYKKGKFDYSQWAKTAQRIREHAPNWCFGLQPNPEGEYVWKTPNGTGYLMGYFQNVLTGVKLPLFPYAVTEGPNRPVPYTKISANDIQNSHRRCLCACACYSFGDAFELWARVEVKEDDQEHKTPETEPGTAKTPTGPNQKLDPVSDKAKNDPPITNDARNAINAKLMKFSEKHPKQMKMLVEDYKKLFKVSKISPITLARQGEFLSHAISKIDDTL